MVDLSTILKNTHILGPNLLRVISIFNDTYLNWILIFNRIKILPISHKVSKSQSSNQRVNKNVLIIFVLIFVYEVWRIVWISRSFVKAEDCNVSLFNPVKASIYQNHLAHIELPFCCTNVMSYFRFPSPEWKEYPVKDCISSS